MTLGEFRDQTRHLRPDIRIDITVGNEDRDIIEVTDFEIHRLDVAEEDGYIELFVFQD